MDAPKLTQADLEYVCSNDVQTACLQAGAPRLGDLVLRMARELIESRGVVLSQGVLKDPGALPPKKTLEALLQGVLDRTLAGCLMVHRTVVEKFFVALATRVRAELPGSEIVISDALNQQWCVIVPSAVMGDDIDTPKPGSTGSA